MVVMFDLPVVSKKQTKAATRFRKQLLDLGFGMHQYSVYLRFSPHRDKCVPLEKRIASAVPPEGRVSVLYVTDKQFGQTVNFTGRIVSPPPKKPQQLALF